MSTQLMHPTLNRITEMLSQLSRLQQDSIVKRGHLYKWHAEQVCLLCMPE